MATTTTTNDTVTRQGVYGDGLSVHFDRKLSAHNISRGGGSGGNGVDQHVINPFCKERTKANGTKLGSKDGLEKPICVGKWPHYASGFGGSGCGWGVGRLGGVPSLSP